HDLVTVGADKHLRLTILKNTAATNLVYQVEVSSDLTAPSWSGTQTTVESETTSELRVRDNLTTASSPHRFIRLKVSSN
nr:hypothetical protein [Akkermansiaceae bacterium]